MSCHRTIIRLSAVLAVVALATGCGDGDSATAPPAPEPARPTTVTVSPATHELTALGTTVQLSAEVLDQNARVMAGATVTWTSSANSVATVDASGLVTAAGNGTATITASVGSASGSAVVTVTQSVASVEVSPSVDELTALGQTVQLTAEAFDENGYAVAGAEFSWESSDVAVATVDAGGLVTGVAAGMATITASAGEASGSAVVTVTQSVASVEVSPSVDELTALGQTVQLTAEAFDENGYAVAGAEFSWESSDAAVATVDAGGLVTGVAAGMATITASAGEASGSAVVTVTQSGASVEVSPSAQTIALGSTLQLTAEAFDENGDAVAGTEFSWESSDAAVATVDAGGLVTGVAAGMATITASAGEASGSAVVTVTQSGASVEVSPSAQTIALGSTLQLTAEAFDENGDAVAGAEFSWESSDAAVATVDAGGLVTGVAAGMATITASAGEASGSAVVTVTQSVASVEVSPSAQTIALGSTLQLTAEAFDENGDAVAGAEFSWESSDAAVATVDAGGLVTGVAAGMATITASAGEASGSSVVTVTPSVASVEVSPSAQTIELGSTLQLTAEAFDENGEAVAEVEFAWETSDAAVAAVDAGGLVTGVAVGTATITASAGSGQGTAEVTVADLDRAALIALYEATDGPNWVDAENWLTDAPLGDWYGVTANALGRVVTLDLTRNGLTGELPASLGSLALMTALRVGGNALSGRLPVSLAHLSLVEFDYADTGLCAPADASFQIWLNGISSHEGTSMECAPLLDREILEILYEATGGPNWTNNDKWLTDAPLGDWYGVRVDNQGRAIVLRLGDNNLAGPMVPQLGFLANLTSLNLGGNALTGTIPPGLGSLTNLKELNLYATNLTGPLPPELGNLANLEWLSLYNSSVSGPIPRELGNLDRLTSLYLNYNQLSGSIPPEFGNLSSLTYLNFSHNNLADEIPRELGDLSALEVLELNNNELTGSVPPAFGRMSSLRQLALAHNPGMHGALPSELTALRQLDVLVATGTRLCAPPDPAFQSWLEGVYKRRIGRCIEGDLPMAYLTQAVQSREFPVPLVAGESALLRVFPTAQQATTEGIPAVRARFYLRGRETHVVDIPGKSDPIPTEVDESSLSKSANAEIPERVVQPGLEMAIEIDPNGTLDRSLGVAKRIPATGRLAVDVRRMPLFDLTLVPLIWTDTQDSSIMDLVGAIAADPENHEMLGDTRTLLPVSDLAVSVHEPVQTSTNNFFLLLQEITAIRAMEGGTDYYMGMMAPPATYASGIARQPGRSSVSLPYPRTIAHELGHNLSLPHAPCGGASDPDSGYPYPDGSIGAGGYDFRGGGRLIGQNYKDLMSYCRPYWLSDYNFTNALRFRLSDADRVGLPAPPPVAPAAVKSLLLWGGMDAEGEPFLNPAFVVDSPPVLPDAAGEHRITGRTASGDELFSFDFAMPEVADGDGSSSFAFVLPGEPDWAGNLASITLSGPGGSVTLDSDTDIPMAILLNPSTGQVRGILRDLPQADRAAALAPQAGLDSLDVLFSRGIPDTATWSR